MQDALVRLLTDPRYLEPTPVPRELAGIDPSRLCMLAQFVHSKRVSKIRQTLPITCSLIGNDGSWDRQFAQHHPSLDARNIANALQFYRFLLRAWRDAPPRHPLLPDIAYCEISLAALTVRRAAAPPCLAVRAAAHSTDQVWGRRSPGVRLRVLTSEAHALLTGQPLAPMADEPINVAVARSRLSGRPALFALRKPVFDLVSALSHWQALGSIGTLTGSLDALAGLEDAGVLEFRVTDNS